MAKFLLVIGFWLIAGNANALDACAKNYSPIAQRYKSGLFFIAQKCGQQPNYVMGTMHTDDPKVIELHKNAIITLENSKAALFEIKMDETAIMQTLQAMYFAPTSGMNLKKAVGDKTYNKFLSKITEPAEGNEMLKPWAAAVILQYPKNTADGVPLDMRLQKFAEGKNINVVGLETPKEQLGIFDSLPMEKQIEMLAELLENYTESKKIEKKMIDSYMAKDLNRLAALIPESIAFSKNKPEAESMLEKLIYHRNVKMAQRAEKYFAAGNGFMAVGALHLPGERGVLDLLENNGYKIEAIY